MGRPSPRTQGIDEEGLPFQKFGTQQLKFIDPAKPALGVTQVDTGKQFKGFTTSGYTGTKTTVFSERIQAGITGAVPVELHDEAVQRQKEKLEEMGLKGVSDVGNFIGNILSLPIDAGKDLFNGKENGEDCGWFGEKCWGKENGEDCDLGCLLTFRGCDCGCKDMKPCTTCDSAVCKECNAWDTTCEDCRKKDGTCTPPERPCDCMPYDFGCEIGCWWEKNKNYVYLIGGLIGLGVLLWLLRPLFGFAKSVTEVSKSAVTKVNGLK